MRTKRGLARRWCAAGVAVVAGLMLAVAGPGSAPAFAIIVDPGGGGGGTDPCSGISASLSISPSTITAGQLVTAQWSVDRPAGCFGNASVLSGPGAPTLAYGVGGSATFQPPSAGTAVYQVTAFSSGRTLVVATRSVTVLAGAPSPDGSFTIVNHASGKCVEVVPNSVGDYFANGNVIQQRTCDGNPTQRWFLSTIRIGGLLADHFVNRYTLQCLDVKDGSTLDRAVVQQWTCNPDATSMAWILGGTDLAPAARTFGNWNSNKCLDVADGSRSDFARLQQYSCTSNNTAQAFFRLP
jgi:hypothetical protein